MIVYTLVFTCVGQNPEENPYINMFDKWLSHLIYNGGLDIFDTIIVMTDDLSRHYIENTYLALPCHLRFYAIYAPYSQIEGICEKYVDNPSVFSPIEMNLFLDVSVLVRNSLKPYYSTLLAKKTLYVHPKGSFQDSEYGGDLVQTDKQLCGFTSGIFGFLAGSEISRFFEFIVRGCLETSKTMSDQPFFNQSIYMAYTEQDFSYLAIVLMKEMGVLDCKEELSLKNQEVSVAPLQ